MVSKEEEKDLEVFAAKIRLQSIISMGSYGSGHVGGVLSSADLFAVLYGKVLKYDATNPFMIERDRVVLSKGHCGVVQYAALALSGFFPLEQLETLNKNGTMLPSHCNMYTKGVDICTGSLGQGASLAAGMALGMNIKKMKSYSYLILGDGECNEGQVWEMALFANHNKLSNLIAFIDLNHQQLDGYTKDICNTGDLGKKFEAFGWHVQNIDGHDISAIDYAITKAKEHTEGPSIIVLDTIKGKGWSQTEGKPNVHHMTLSKEQVEQAKYEIENYISLL